MSIATRTVDHDIQQAVSDELAWTPELVGAAPIQVSVEDGIVRLHGTVDRLLQRVAAQRAASRVRGVRAVEDDIEVSTSVWDHSDEDVAAAVEHALTWSAEVPAGVHAAVKKGVVILTGEVQWNHERRAAERLAERIEGVNDVDNRIALNRRPSGPDTRERIQHALVRNAIVDASHIDVDVDGTKIILRGTVRTWLEKSQAARTAWASPHVTEVDNRIIVTTD
jgi:osmotically-inducible protein OsmY